MELSLDACSRLKKPLELSFVKKREFPTHFLGNILKRTFQFHVTGEKLEKEKSLGRTNDLFLKHFDEYLSQIEKVTEIKIPEKQRELLRQHALTHPIYLLPMEERRKHRKDYDLKKRSLVEDWEKNTGQKWPYTKGGENYNGKIVSLSPTRYQLHHIILISFNGPNEWWNFQPAQPILHQEVIHGPNSVSKKIFQ